MKKLAKGGGKKKEKKQWAQPSSEKPKKEKKAEVMGTRLDEEVAVVSPQNPRTLMLSVETVSYQAFSVFACKRRRH